MSTLGDSSLLKPKTHMQSIPSMDMIVIEDYYHMTTMGENVNWMNLAHLLSMFSLNLRPYCTSVFSSMFLIAFLKIYALEKNNTSPLCILCTIRCQKEKSLLTLTLVVHGINIRVHLGKNL